MLLIERLELDKKYNVREDVVFTDLDDGSSVLLHLETKYYFSLNETGTFLWRLLDKEDGTTGENMAKDLCEAYDVAPDRARQDVSEFLTNLNEQGLIIKG